MAEETHLPAAAAEQVLGFAGALGVPRETLLDAAGLTPAPSISFAELCALYEEAARLTGDRWFGLHVGERTSPGQYGLLGYVAANRATLHDAMTTLIGLQQIWTDAAGLELRLSRGTFALGYWHRGSLAPECRRQESEQMLSALLCFIRGALGRQVRPTEVRFEHRAPDDLREHERLFQAPILFAAPVTEIVFAADLLEAPIAHADPVLGGLVKDQAEAALAARPKSGTLSERIRQGLRARLLEGEAWTLAAAATEAGLSPRGLQRGLATQGLSFRRLSHEARLDFAQRLLLDPRLSLAEIAHRLGFSQPSAFHRAFRRAFGATPRQFRIKARSGARR